MVIIGATFVDVKGYPEEKLIADGRNAGRVETMHGGVCRNISEDIARMTGKATFVSLVDDTAAGREVAERLARCGVDTRYLQAQPCGMGTWLAIFDENGDVACSLSQRPNLSALEALLDEKGDEMFADAEAVLFEIDMAEEIVSRIFALAGKHGTKVYSCVSNMTEAMKRRAYLPKTDCFVCNAQEAGMLFNSSFTEGDDRDVQEKLLRCIRMEQIPCMVVTCGGRGAIYAQTDGSTGCVTGRRVQAADTTGAGDAFFAGLCAALDQGCSMKEACEVGNEVAAMVVERKDNVCPDEAAEVLKKRCRNTAETMRRKES